ncbi:MAG: Ig-like domain-containing protein, partial [Acidobacteriota bacterium]|nr:Ig-like domain-containing protein [Acidobacteriota bacterium]
MRIRLAVLTGLTLAVTITIGSWLIRGQTGLLVANQLSSATAFAAPSRHENHAVNVFGLEPPSGINSTAVVAVDDNYTVHISGRIGPFSSNDTGPNGPGFDSYRILTLPAHGTLDPVWNDTTRYTHEIGFTGTDSFIYEICEAGECDTATVTITVVNLPPIAVDDRYKVSPPSTRIGIFSANDDDTDDDAFETYRIVTMPAHGRLEPVTSDAPLYYPQDGYSGPDSFVYEVCDVFNACSTATVYINDDDANAGLCLCNAGVGQPINVTNGNTYVQQTDYQLPSVGEAIEITRTYNSSSMHVKLFGRGWSSAYDETVTQFSNNDLRLLQSDGRAVDFILVSGTANTYNPRQEDFRGQILQLGGGEFKLNLKNGEVHEFNARGKLLSMTDRNNNQTSLFYDANGNLVGLTDPFGRMLSVTSNVDGRVLSIADALGTVATYTYGASNELLTVTYADNSRFQFAYDGGNHLTSVSDALGNIIESHTYDSDGRGLTSERQGAVEHYTLNYVSDSETDVTDALGHVTKYTVDKSKGRNLVTKVEGLCSCGSSQVLTWTYDNQSNVTAKTDALNRTTTSTYDADGNRLTQTDASGTVVFTYNQLGEVLTRTDQLNNLTTNAYDAAGNPLTTTNALGKATNFAYDTRGLILTLTDARGKVTSFAYDSSGNLTSKTDALSHVTQFAYDARSRLTSVTNALGHMTAFAYDGVGRPTQTTQADGTIIGYEYDLAGRRTATIDAKGNRTTYAYDGANRLTNETDPLNQSTSYGYDLMSNLISQTDALGRVTEYEYDDFNRLKKVTYPPATPGTTRLFETLAYDAGGNVTQRTDTAGRVTTYANDELNRVTSTTDPDNKVTSFEYDALSRTTALV